MARTRGAKAAATNSKSPQTKKATRKVIAKPATRVTQKQNVQRKAAPSQRKAQAPQKHVPKIFFNGMSCIVCCKL